MRNFDPAFDFWSLLFLVASVQGLFIAFVLWRWKKGLRPANRLLSGLLFLFALTMAEYVLFWTRYDRFFPHLSNVSAQFPYLYGPIVWLYLRVVYERRLPSWKDAWMLAPFIMSLVPFLPWYAAPVHLKQAVLAGEATFDWPQGALRAFFWGRLASLTAFTAWCAFYVSTRPRVGESSRWAKQIVGFFAVFSLAYMSYYYFVRFDFFNPTWDYHISAVMTAMIYMIAYSGYAQPAVFDGFKWSEPSGRTVKYRNSGLTPDASKSLLASLERNMREHYLYRDPEISLDKLADTMGASKHHVSQVINEHLGASFFDYINGLRVEDAKQMLAETTRTEAHVLEIAYAVGFNNKASFNAAFKRMTGMTPSAFRSSRLERVGQA